MELLKEFIRNKAITDLNGKTYYRKAVRGVIIKDNKLLMVYSAKDGDYKFPGGGVKEGETLMAALAREVNEESGAKVISVNGELGRVIEFDLSIKAEYDIFKMESFYYICDVSPDFGSQSLDDYEQELGFTPVWVDIDEAISVNQALICSDKHPRWTPRETFMLGFIKDKFML
ncbi:MAG: NUDIX domain-containing protein [Eubacteriales bacterium]|jgi:8-oxo-dGTP pyrophosphatase MutT (NUDIX family)